MNKIEAAKLNDDEKEAECARLMALVERDHTEAIGLVMSIIRDKSHPLVFPMLGTVMDFIDPPEKPPTLAEIFAEARARVVPTLTAIADDESEPGDRRFVLSTGLSYLRKSVFVLS